jgi:hypothetical protein
MFSLSLHWVGFDGEEVSWEGQALALVAASAWVAKLLVV